MLFIMKAVSVNMQPKLNNDDVQAAESDHDCGNDCLVSEPEMLSSDSNSSAEYIDDDSKESNNSEDVCQSFM